MKPTTGPALTSHWAPPGMSGAADPHTIPVALTHSHPELVGAVGGGWWLLERRVGVGDGALVGAGGYPAPSGAAGGSSMGGSMGSGPSHVLGPDSRADWALLQRGGWPRGDPLPAVSPSLTYTGDAACLLLSKVTHERARAYAQLRMWSISRSGRGTPSDPPVEVARRFIRTRGISGDSRRFTETRGGAGECAGCVRGAALVCGSVRACVGGWLSL